MKLLQVLKTEADNQDTDIVRVIQGNTILGEAFPLALIEHMDTEELEADVVSPKGLRGIKVHLGDKYNRLTIYLKEGQ